MASSSLSDLGETATDEFTNVAEVSDSEHDILNGNGSLVSKANAASHGRIAIEDWSETGRGVHIDFEDRETVPLKQGQFLCRGATGDVHETTVQGRKLAHKKIYFTRRVREKEKKEVVILTKLVHAHITQLIGTYTHKKVLGVLMYPVAVCDLHTFFEDIEAWTNIAPNRNPGAELNSLDPIHRSRLEHLGYNFPAKMEQQKATLIYSKIGCLVSAVAYLHDQSIRHKDLKPSNILLSRENIWLSDFGSATDFTLLSQSATNNERGTPRYFAPEVADWKPSGRAADIFSLGCVLVEILCLHRRGSLDQIRKHRSLDPSFHANLDQLTIWLQKDDDKFLREEYYLEQEIGLMLSRDPARRPTATQLLRSITVHDIEKDETSTTYLFGPCCKGALITSAVHVAAIAELEERFRRSTEHIKRQYDEQQRRLTEIMEWKLEDCRKEYEYLAEKNFRKWKRTHEELAQRSNMQLMERKLEERKKEYEYVAEINFRKWKKSHEELAQRSSMQEKELIDTRVQLNALKRLSVTPASRPFSLFPFAQSQHLLASQDPSSFEDKRGQFAPQWPTRPRRIIEEHHGYDSYSDPESSRSSDRTADTGPEFSRGTLNGVDDPSALLRTPGVGRRRPVPTAPKIYNPVEDMMEQIPRQFGENDVSEDKKKPAKPSLRDRLGLLSRSRRN